MPDQFTFATAAATAQAAYGLFNSQSINLDLQALIDKKGGEFSSATGIRYLGSNNGFNAPFDAGLVRVAHLPDQVDGFSATVFRLNNTRQAILAIRGSNSASDFLQDVKLGVVGFANDQFIAIALLDGEKSVLCRFRRRRRNLRLIDSRELHDVTELDWALLLHRLPDGVGGFVEQDFVGHEWENLADGRGPIEMQKCSVLNGPEGAESLSRGREPPVRVALIYHSSPAGATWNEWGIGSDAALSGLSRVFGLRHRGLTHPGQALPPLRG